MGDIFALNIVSSFRLNIINYSSVLFAFQIHQMIKLFTRRGLQRMIYSTWFWKWIWRGSWMAMSKCEPYGARYFMAWVSERSAFATQWLRDGIIMSFLCSQRSRQQLTWICHCTSGLSITAAQSRFPEKSRALAIQSKNEKIPFHDRDFIAAGSKQSHRPYCVYIMYQP